MKCFYFLWIILLIAQTTFGQTRSQKVSFAKFSLVINNFYSECYNYSRFPEDSAIPLKIIDTIFICETPCDSNGWYIDGQTIQLSSKLANNTFELSYANEYNIYQGFDSRTIKEPKEGWEDWYSKSQNMKYSSNYKKVEQLSASSFKLPHRQNNTDKIDLSNIKQKFGLRDTLIDIPHEEGQELLIFAKGRKLFSLVNSNLSIRIKRFANGQLKETKYVIVEISEGCD